MGNGRATEDIPILFQKQLFEKTISWERAGQRRIFIFVFSKNETLKKRFPGKRQGNGGYSVFVPKNKTLKEYSLGKGKATDDIQTLSKNKTSKTYSLGKGRATEDIQIFVLEIKL